MIEDVMDGFQADKNAAIVEAATKLALDWADLQRPVSKEALASAVKTLIQAYNAALSEAGELEKQAIAGVVKSGSRLTTYWYNQNKSADVEQLVATINQFISSILVELK